MAANPHYPTSYLRQMIYPFTGAGGCAFAAPSSTVDAEPVRTR
jgi:hypothetical protein